MDNFDSKHLSINIEKHEIDYNDSQNNRSEYSINLHLVIIFSLFASISIIFAFAFAAKKKMTLDKFENQNDNLGIYPYEDLKEII